MLSKIKFEWPLLRMVLDVRLQAKEAVAPYRTIDWDPVRQYQELSICAEISTRSAPRGRWRDSMFGQCRDEVSQQTWRLDGPQDAALTELLAIWKRWHLNGMNAGIRPQRNALRARAEFDGLVLEYSRACKHLDGLGLLTTPALGLITPDATQYTYGSAWLVELLPDEVERDVRRLCQTLGAVILEAA